MHSHNKTVTNKTDSQIVTECTPLLVPRNATLNLSAFPVLAFDMTLVDLKSKLVSFVPCRAIIIHFLCFTNCLTDLYVRI